MVTYLGWIIAAFLGGILLSLWLLHRKAPHSLRDRFARVESFQRRSYREILVIAGAKPNHIHRQADGHTLKTWCEEGYSIALEFDAQDVCLGVMREEFE